MLVKWWWGEETGERYAIIGIFPSALQYALGEFCINRELCWAKINNHTSQCTQARKIKATAFWRKHRCFLFLVNHMLTNIYSKGSRNEVWFDDNSNLKKIIRKSSINKCCETSTKSYNRVESNPPSVYTATVRRKHSKWKIQWHYGCWRVRYQPAMMGKVPDLIQVSAAAAQLHPQRISQWLI